MAGRQQQPPPPDVSEDAAANDEANNPNTPPSPPHHLEAEVGGGCGRRDENALSFRHFLQPQSDVVPTARHRAQRSVGNAGVDLVDIPQGLPDFVQDQLIAEAQAEVSQPILDLAPVPSASGQASGRLHHHYGGLHSEIILGAHLPLPTSSSSASASQNHTSSLPDFLSDGPMYYDASNSDTGGTTGTGLISGSSRNGPSETTTRSEAHLRASSFDSDSLHTQNERLRRDVMDKSRRISYLESECSRQEAEINGLLGALSDSAESLRLSHERAATAEAQVTRLSAQLAQLQDELSSGRLGSGDSGAGSSHNMSNGLLSYSPSQNRSAQRVNQIVHVTEDLLRQLLEQVAELRSAAALSTDPQQEGDKRKQT